MMKLTMLGIGHPFVGDFSTEIVLGKPCERMDFSQGELCMRNSCGEFIQIL